MPAGYSTWDYDKVKTVTDIDDIINESVRLKTPLLQGSPRETPAHGVQVATCIFPEMSMSRCHTCHPP
jgi:hypothetical protein